MRLLYVSTLLTLGAMTIAQARDNDPVVMTVAGQDVRSSEFAYFYGKNNQADLDQGQSFDEYVDLFINYKLKVAEALSRGIDTTAAYRDELAGYRKQIAEPYVNQTDRRMDELVQEVVDRRKTDVRAAHILLRLDEQASDSAVAAVRSRIDSLQQQLAAGASFDSLARAVSEDPSARQNGGDLGYFTTMQMVYPFESAAFNTPVGSTTVCRSRFGYHIVKVTDRRPSRGEVSPAHIMRTFPQPLTPQGQMEARRVIDSLYMALQAGADFGDLARRYSDDQYTASSGGAYSWINATSGFPKPWIDAAYSLEVGQYSKPVRTDFGWHIIKLLDRRAAAPDDEDARATLRQQLQHDADRMAHAKACAAADWRSRYKLPEAWTDDEVFDWADQHLEENDVDFRYLYKEYHDGILLFEVAGSEVWNKAERDSAGLHDYFVAHRSNYAWDAPRFRGAFIECAADSALVARLRDIYTHHDYRAAADTVRRTVLTDSILTPDPKHPRFHIVNGLYAPGDNETVDAQQLGVDKTPRPKPEMPVQMTFGTVLPDGPETEDDVRAVVIADYQTVLEEQWVARLREKYTWKVRQKELDRLRARYVKK